MGLGTLLKGALWALSGPEGIKAAVSVIKAYFLVVLSVTKQNKENVIRPLLDNGLKGGNSESPERASICNHFGVCLYVGM